MHCSRINGVTKIPNHGLLADERLSDATPPILNPSEALSKIEGLRLSSIPYEHHVSALAVIAVLAGLKPAFMGDEVEFLEEYKVAGRRLGLRVLVTVRPAVGPYRVRKPRVPVSFIEAFHGGGTDNDRRATWLFKEAKTSERISSAASGELDEGYVLGYPECCRKAHAEDRATLVETVYNQIIDRYHAKTEEEAVRILLTDPPFRVPKIRVRQSFEKFPFISHVACSECIQGKSEESSGLNRRLRGLGAEVGLKDRVIETMTDFLANESARVLRW